MYRTGITRSVYQLSSRRAALVFRASSKNLVRRAYSSAAHGKASGSKSDPLHWSLGAAAALSAIYFVYPFEKKPKESKEEPNEEPQQESSEESEQKPEQAQETEQEPEQGSEENSQENEPEQKDAEPEQQSEQKEQQSEQKAPEQESEQPKQEPKKEDTVTSTDAHQTDKDVKSDEEIQRIEEKKLAPTDEEAQQEGAYNPDTGEINWDCPCLGGMAHGPCGEEFKAAFSCFVYSEAEPKGIDCVEKFQHMQDCFRKYPEHYAEQIKDEDEAVASQNGQSEKAKDAEKPQSNNEPKKEAKNVSNEKPKEEPKAEPKEAPKNEPKAESNPSTDATEKN